MTGRLGLISVLACGVLACGSALWAQDIPAGKGPGSYVAVGATFSDYNSDYGKRDLAGATVFVDANVYNRFGLEAEGRRLQFHSDDGTKLSTYLGGPRFSRDFRSFRPYTKFLAGRGEFDFPYGYAKGTYFMVAAGAGLDWRIGNRLFVRVIDFEYQRWSQFTFGNLTPYGISTGLSFRVF